MRPLVRLAAVVALSSLLGGCIYQDVVVPLDRDLDRTQLGTLRGESTARTWFGAVQLGDAGVQAAAEDGGLSVLYHADQRFFNVLGVYQERTTIVYGE